MTSIPLLREAGYGQRTAAARLSRLARAIARHITVHNALVGSVALAFFVVFWFSYPRDPGERPIFNSPRESVGYYLTERFLDGHGFSSPLMHYDELPPDIAVALTPRDAASVDGRAVPRDFAGTMLLYAAVMFVHPALALLVGPALAVVGGWALMRITRRLFGEPAGTLAFVCWLAFPPLWINASFIFTSDMPALTLLLLGVLAFVRYWERQTLTGALALGACFAGSVLFRYPNVMIAAPFAIALLVTGRTRPTHVVAAAAVAAPFAGAVLAFNAYVYGDPLTTGFHLGAEIVDQTVNYSKESFFKRRPDVLAQYLRTYALLPIISVPVAISLLATLVASRRREGAARALAVVAVATFVLLLGYYGQQDAWGYKSAQVAASFLRYLLPGFALLAVFGAWALSEAIRRWGNAMYVLPLALVAASASWVSVAPGGLKQVYGVVDRSKEFQRQVVAATEPDAVIAVRITDKFLYPQRQTLTLTYAIQNDEPFSKGQLETWDYVPSPERFASVAERTYESGVSLYFIPDARVGHVAPYQDALVKRGYYLRSIQTVTAAPLFKVSKLNE